MTHTLFACDMNQEVGLGHVSRCLGLAEATSSLGGKVSFLGNPSAAAADLIKHAKFSLEVVPCVPSTECSTRIAQHCKHNLNGSVVIDSYLIDSTFLETLQDHIKPNRLCLIDDAGLLPAYPCDLILNFTANAKKTTYPNTTAELLLGPRYFPAKQWHRRVRDARKDRVTAGPPQKILVFIAGNDEHHVTVNVVRALSAIDPSLHVRAIMPNGHPDVTQLNTSLNAFRHPGELIGIRKDFEELLNWTDVLVCGGGLTKYEAIYAGIPTATISLNRLQAFDTAWFSKQQALCELGSAPITSAELEAQLRNFLASPSRLAEFRHRALNCIPENAGQLVARKIMSL